MLKQQNIICLLKEYVTKISLKGILYVGKEISVTQTDIAINKTNIDLTRDALIGYCDTSFYNNGSEGCIFTEKTFQFWKTGFKSVIISYKDINNIEVLRMRLADNYRSIKFTMKNGDSICWDNTEINKTILKCCLDGIIGYRSKIETDEIFNNVLENQESKASFLGGNGVGTFYTVNKLYDEEKFTTRQGHGFAAERANTLYDNVTGHNATVVGDDNAKNGPDRVVDGNYIQSKYCASGSRCVNECFTKAGKFRYFLKNGKPMQIEVPSDQYEAAVTEMENKIRNGQVNGVTDPLQAKSIVRKGHFTYKQARNMAKAHTIESLEYDAVSGTITAGKTFGVSFLITFACSRRSGDTYKVSLKKATVSGAQVAGKTFFVSVASSQALKLGLNSVLVTSSEVIATRLGPNVSAKVINAFRDGSKIYGAAAMKSTAKLLRGNVVTSGFTIVVLTSADIVNAFRGRISGKQLFKNAINNTATVVAGTGGWIGGAAVGTAVCPGIGTVVGRLLGSISAGEVASVASNKVVGMFIEDDAEEMVRIVQSELLNIANDYLLDKQEVGAVVEELQKELDVGKLKDMFASNNRQKFADDILVPIVEKQVSQRSWIDIPSREEVAQSIIEVAANMEA